MPRIVEYSAPDGAIPQPNDEAIRSARDLATVSNIFNREAGQALGGAISHVGGQIGHGLDYMVQEAKDHEDRQQIGFGAAQSAALWADLTRGVNDTIKNSDPNDTSVGPGLMEKTINPSLDKFTQSFDNARPAVQKWAQQTADTMRQHFTKTIVADEMTRAAVAVGRNVGELERALSFVASNDPTSLTDVIAKFDSDLAALTGARTLSVQQQAAIDKEVPKIHERLAFANFIGLAQNNPQAAIQALKRGDFDKYTDSVTLERWEKIAAGIEKTKREDARRERIEAKQEFVEKSAERAAEYQLSTYDQKTDRVLRIPPNLNMQIRTDPSLTNADKQRLIAWNKADLAAQEREDKLRAKGNGTGAKDYAPQLENMVSRIGATDNPLTKEEVVEALGNEMITRKTAHDLIWRINQRDPDAKTFQQSYNTQFANVRHSINTSPLYAASPERAAQIVNRIDADAQRIINNTPPGKERRDLLDPTSSTYLFKPEAIRANTPPPRAVVQQQADTIRAGERVTGVKPISGVAPAPRATVADYDRLKPGDTYTDPQGNVRTKR